jgi:hypothetical protein
LTGCACRAMTTVAAAVRQLLCPTIAARTALAVDAPGARFAAIAPRGENPKLLSQAGQPIIFGRLTRRHRRSHPVHRRHPDRLGLRNHRGRHCRLHEHN